MKTAKFFTCVALVVWMSASAVAQTEDEDQGKKKRQMKADQPQAEKTEPQKRRGQRNDRAAAGLIRALKQMDQNKDGVIAKDEANPRLQQRWDRLDTNGDGSLDKTEIKAIVQRLRNRSPGPGQSEEAAGQRRDRPTAKQVMQRLDKNGNGTLSKDELPERLQQRWDMLDKNGDDELDQAELKSFLDRVRQMGQPGDRAGKRRGDGKKGENEKGPVKPKRPGGDGG